MKEKILVKFRDQNSILPNNNNNNNNNNLWSL